MKKRYIIREVISGLGHHIDIPMNGLKGASSFIRRQQENRASHPEREKLCNVEYDIHRDDDHGFDIIAKGISIDAGWKDGNFYGMTS